MRSSASEAGIPELWIVDLNREQIEVLRGPSSQGYRDSQAHTRGETITIAALPGIMVSVEDLAKTEVACEGPSTLLEG